MRFETPVRLAKLSVQFLVVARDGELREFLDHVVGRTEEDPRIGGGEHAGVVVGVPSGEDGEAELSKRFYGVSFLILEPDVVVDDLSRRVRFDPVAEQGRPAQLFHQRIRKFVERVGQDHDLVALPKSIQELARSSERGHASDRVLDLPETESFVGENVQAEAHQPVVVRLVACGAAQRVDARAIRDVDPYFGYENTLEVEADDFHRLPPRADSFRRGFITSDTMRQMTVFPGAPRLAAAAKAVFTVVAIGATGVLSTACSEGADGSQDFAESDPVSVEISTVEAGPLRDIAGFSGQLSAENTVMVKAEDDGIVAEFFFEEGQEVQEGEPLFRLRNGEQVARLREAEANLKLARGVSERTHKLLKQDAVSQAKRDEVAANLAVAKARVELARVELERSVIRAPFDGVLGIRLVAPGARVDENTPLVAIDAVDRLQVAFAIAEVGVLFARVGTPIELTVAPYPKERFPGEVFFVSPTLESATRRLIVKAWVDNSDRRLRPGLFARIHMQVAERENAILLPETAVVFDRRGTYVWRVGEDMVVSKVPVETGLRRDGSVEVTLGLQAGDRVVTAGTHKVDEGDKVVAATPRSGAIGQARREVPAPAGDGA